MRPRAVPTLFALLALAACAGKTRPVFDDPTRPIAVAAGSEFDLALGSNQSTGYRWMLADSAALGGAKLVGTSYRSSAPERNGSGGTERWTFRAPQRGSAVIALVYRRPWESRPPADSARFTVTVR